MNQVFSLLSQKKKKNSTFFFSSLRTLSKLTVQVFGVSTSGEYPPCTPDWSMYQARSYRLGSKSAAKVWREVAIFPTLKESIGS